MTELQTYAPKRPRRKRRSLLRFIPVFAVLVFSVISFVATAMGMHGLLSSLGKVSEYLSLGIAGAFTLALQLFLVWAVRLVRISPRPVTRAWWLMVYTICLFVSVGFAYAFWFHAIAADSYSRETYSTQARGVLFRLQEFRQEYDRIAFSLSDLQAYSQQTSEDEIAYGGTCGDNSPPTRGPRARLRERDARYFATMAPHFKTQQAGIGERIDELEGSLVSFDPDSLGAYRHVANRALIQARGLQNDPQLRTLKTWMSQRLEQGRTSFTAPSGEVFSCPDPYLEEQATLLLATELPYVPEDFVWFDASERQESVQLAFSRLLHILRLDVGSDTAFMPKSVDGIWNRAGDAIDEAAMGRPFIKDVLPLVFGLITDLLIFLAAMAAPWRDDEFKESLDSLARAQAEHPTLGRDFFDRLESFMDPERIPVSYRLLQAYAVSDGGRDYIFLPEPARSAEHVQLRILMEFLVSARVAAVFRPLLSREKAPKALIKKLDAAETPQADVRLYRLREGFLQELAGELFASHAFTAKTGSDGA